jgi:hypothetical protein
MIRAIRYEVNFMTAALACSAAAIMFNARLAAQESPPAHDESKSIKIFDLSGQRDRLVVVDREEGVYLGHPSTCLLEDGKTILCVYPQGHGKGEIFLKRSGDGGQTWSNRLPTPSSWKTSRETPTIHRMTGPDGRRRVILFSGLYPARMAQSEDNGESWSELQKIGDWGGIVVMGSVFDLRTGPGHYMGMFHDDGRFATADSQSTDPQVFTVYRATTIDGGLTWSTPVSILSSTEKQLCEPFVIRSPEGKQLACLLRENSRRHNSQIMLSNDEGNTWSAPRDLPDWLCGDRHIGKYTPDGRLIISFRCRWKDETNDQSRFEGDWVGWIGEYSDLVSGKQGAMYFRFKENHKDADCGYSGVEVLADGTIVAIAYGHWDEGQSPYILETRFTIGELDEIADR